MFDIGWPEFLVVAIVLIVVVGPKDLPRMLRAFGRTTSKLRSMAGEFRSQFDEALKEADLDEVRQTLSDARKLNPTKGLRDAVNPFRQAGDDIRKSVDDAMKPKPAENATPAEQKLAEPKPVSVPESPVKLDAGPPTIAEPAAANAPATKPIESKAPAKQTPAKKPAAKKPAEKKTPAKKPAASGAAATKKAPAKAAAAKSSPAKTASKPASKATPAKAAAKSTAGKASAAKAGTARKAPAKKPAAKAEKKADNA